LGLEMSETFFLSVQGTVDTQSNAEQACSEIKLINAVLLESEV